MLESLPDPILHQIFSLLPTRQLVQSSALSRRFRHLWRTAVDLSFSEPDFGPSSASEEAAESLSDAVESVLLLRDRSVDIHRFHLNCRSNWIQQRRLSTWLRFVAGGNLRHLDLSIPGGSDLPSNVFACQSLRELNVRMQYWEIRLPNPINLSNLRILSISDVDFLEDEVKLGELISACPLLLRLSLTRCYFNSLSVRAEKLERFTFHHYDFNAVRLRLSTPRLRYLEHICEGTEDFVVGDLPCLVEGSFDLRGYTWSGACEVVDILRGLRNAQLLTLNDFAISFPSSNRDLIGSLPLFNKLRSLKLINSLKRDICQSVKCLLECAPNLESLTIEEPVTYDIYPISENGESHEIQEPMIYGMYPISEDKGSYWKKMALPITYIDRIVDIDVQQVDRSCDSMYNIVKFWFLNLDPWKRSTES